MVLEACRDRGSPLPEALQNAPELLPGLDLYYDAFFALNSCRGGMGGPIPWTAIREYASYLAMGEDEFDRLVLLIREMESERDAFLKEKENKGS